MSFTSYENYSESRINDIGKVLSTTGAALLIIHAIAVPIVVDTVILIDILSSKSKSNDHAFLTGYFLGSCRFNAANDFRYQSMGWLILSSIIESMVLGIALSMHFHTPIFAMAIAATWAISAGLVLLGTYLENYHAKKNEDLPPSYDEAVGLAFRQDIPPSCPAYCPF